MRSIAMGVMVVTLAAGTIEAQILDRRSASEPRAWISGSIGLFDLGVLDDGTSGARWRFSNAAQFRGSLAYALGRGNSLGVTVGYARVPITYTPIPGGGGEDANATVSTVMLSFRGGAGAGLHQVFEASVGAMRFSDFSSDEDGRRLEPLDADFDVTFAIGGGFG